VSRRRVTGFVDARGEWQELHNPNGRPTWRQLVALYRAGALRLTGPGCERRFTKAEASFAISNAVEAGLLERRAPRDPRQRYDRVCRAIVEHVRAHPGCSTSAVVAVVPSAGAFTSDRIRDLLELGVLVDRARPGRGRGRRLHVNEAAAMPAGVPG
jgi:hypothetical protein